ncbi:MULTISPECIES: fatty acid desaturase [Pseudomonas syringae group]|uniref:Fatty acid desaturase n=2 Tax=Pseudomonas syringae group TaxID=136849 RepID=A0ABY1U6U7_PSESX|nr:MULTISPECIES: fatty acid desaturase [Pseudomonas syringae group]KWT11649.1 fatty acid desaturase [Pseudomonas syringae pv. avii]SOQ09893.1 fatty acid desaturase [Pseudomonas syringae pv. persicae]SOQ10158.1 fatty acid desaturase [Pseudomonas syringae pv. persicae]SOS26992.1 fatty acid desaturase [Pseudomonas syringae pv. avii]
MHPPHSADSSVDRPFAWLAMYLLVTGLLYFLVTHVPMGSVRLVQPSGVDAHFPLLPFTLPLYLSYTLVMPLLVYMGRQSSWLLPTFFAGALAAGLCLVCHLFWPTMILRPETGAAWLDWLYRLDAPLAASPSGHVALPVAISVAMAGLRLQKAWVFAVWSVVLMLTVMTTGQHVFTDMAYGAAIGVACGAATLIFKRCAVDLRTLSALLLEWLCILVTIRVALYLADWRFYLLAMLIVAARQHALFVLYHDATHYNLTRRRSTNDFLINLAIGVPGLVPIEFYRPLHLDHHQHAGTEQDPERRFLYYRQPWRFQPLSAKLLLRQLLGDLLMVNTLRNIAAYKAAGGAPPKITRPLIAAALVWLMIVACLVWQCSIREVGMLAMLWFIPLVTVGTLLQKIRSIAEYSGGPGVTPGWQEWTYAWRVGWLGRFFIWPYHINLHLQHHRTASIPWHALPSAVGKDEKLLPSRALPTLMWSGLRRKT